MIARSTINSILSAMHLGQSPFVVNSMWLALSNAGAGEPSSAIGYRRVALHSEDFTWNSSLYIMENNLKMGFPACTSGEYGDTSSRKLITLANSSGGATAVFQNSASGWGTGENRCTSGTTLVFDVKALNIDLNTSATTFVFGRYASQSLTAAAVGYGPFQIQSTYLGLLSPMYNPLVNSIAEFSTPVISLYERKGMDAWSFSTDSFYVTNANTVMWELGTSGGNVMSLHALAMFDTATEGTGNLIWALRLPLINFGGMATDQIYILPGGIRIGMI